MQTDLSIYNSLRPSFIEGVHAVKFNALSAVISRYRDYARSSEQIKAYSGDSLLMRDIASLLDEAPRPITREYQDFTPFLLLLMLSEEFHAVHYVERLVTWYFGYCCVDELRTVCTILSQCSYPHHDTLRLRFKNYLREARKTLGMPVECNAAVMLKMLDASYEHLTPADVGEFEELLHLGTITSSSPVSNRIILPRITSRNSLGFAGIPARLPSAGVSSGFSAARPPRGCVSAVSNVSGSCCGRHTTRCRK